MNSDFLLQKMHILKVSIMNSKHWHENKGTVQGDKKLKIKLQNRSCSKTILNLYFNCKSCQLCLWTIPNFVNLDAPVLKFTDCLPQLFTLFCLWLTFQEKCWFQMTKGMWEHHPPFALPAFMLLFGLDYHFELGRASLLLWGHASC